MESFPVYSENIIGNLKRNLPARISYGRGPLDIRIVLDSKYNIRLNISDKPNIQGMQSSSKDF